MFVLLVYYVLYFILYVFWELEGVLWYVLFMRVEVDWKGLGWTVSVVYIDLYM